MAREYKSFEPVTAERSGTFEALIATFDKPDKHGDVVRRGAFTFSIQAWRQKGAKIPVVFSHQSEDIDQHIGEVDPADLEETATGLIARGRLYLDEPRAAKVHKQLLRKALTEWSFAFKVLKKNVTEKGRELLALHLYELGPTLVGVGDTETIAVKSADLRRTDPHAEARARVELLQRRVGFALGVAHRL